MIPECQLLRSTHLVNLLFSQSKIQPHLAGESPELGNETLLLTPQLNTSMFVT